MISETDVLSNSILSVRFATMCAAINTKMLNPNYPIMVTPGAHPDSFPDTEPFDFNSATYFLPMCSLLGVAIASIFLGQISDKVGRKRVILVLSLISAVGSVVKYFTSATFWGFCITQFIFGFFLGNLPVAMAYVGDVYTSKKKKEQELGILVSFYVMGNSGGGIIAILMNATGLFSPLWVGAGLMVVAAVGTSWYMVEAGDERLLATTLEDGDGLLVGGDEEEEPIRPEVIDKKALWNIVLGAVFDNFGSTGLFPLCLSPLAIDRYLLDFVNAEPPEDPIMSIIGYQWLSVMVAGMVVPSTFMTPTAFRKFGVAGTCVMGNVMTAIVTLALLLIGNAVSRPTTSFSNSQRASNDMHF
jgi:MFS family permease